MISEYRYKGYCSDLQRTWYVLKKGEKTAPPEVEKGFNVIRDSIQMVADAIKPGVKGVEMDDIARNYILSKDMKNIRTDSDIKSADKCTMAVQDLFPRWERYGNTPFMQLEESQVFTIEPRLTVKDYGTSTLEEEVVLTKDGCKFLSKPQKKLMLIKNK